MTNAIGWRYGLMGLPLAVAGLPVYLHLPPHYAQQGALSLGVVGLVLLASRLLDAVIDPVLGRWVNGWRTDALAPAWQRARPLSALAALLLAIGFAALWYPPPGHALLWLAALLVPTYLGLSTLMLWHNALGVRLGRSREQRSRVAAWREGMGLVGVVLASTLMGLGTPAWVALLLAVALATAWWVLPVLSAETNAMPLRDRAPLHDQATPALPSVWAVWRAPGFAPLWTVYTLNALASAVAATALPFFVAEHIVAVGGDGANSAGSARSLSALLALYFVAAAASIPLWLRGVHQRGLAWCWGAGMVLAMASFALVWALPDDVTVRWWSFAAICIATGLAVGADLVCPPALLAGVSQRHPGQAPEGLAFGWWAFASKLSLAAAAGLALPLLQALGYQPGSHTAALHPAVLWVYAGLPLALKLLAWLGLRAMPAEISNEHASL